MTRKQRLPKPLRLFLLLLTLSISAAAAQTEPAANPDTALQQPQEADINVTKQQPQTKGITSFTQRFKKSRKVHETHSYVQVADDYVNTSGMTELEIGKEPTAEQLKNLKEDMVWIKEEKIGGYTIHYPVVYLAPEHNQSDEADTSKKEKK